MATMQQVGELIAAKIAEYDRVSEQGFMTAYANQGAAQGLRGILQDLVALSAQPAEPTGAEPPVPTE